MSKCKCKCCGCDLGEIKERLDICPNCGKNPGVEGITSVIKKSKKQASEAAGKKKKS